MLSFVASACICFRPLRRFKCKTLSKPGKSFYQIYFIHYLASCVLHGFNVLYDSRLPDSSISIQPLFGGFSLLIINSMIFFCIYICRTAVLTQYDIIISCFFSFFELIVEINKGVFICEFQPHTQESFWLLFGISCAYHQAAIQWAFTICLFRGTCIQSTCDITVTILTL